LTDRQTKKRLLARLAKVELGNLGDWKSIEGTKNLYELREHFGSGYRIFYTIIDRKIVLLLAGSDKSDPKRIIVKAKEYLEDYEKRKAP
jgi:putative addiction module killer protein